jgi:Holliday junction resolvase RusA-like endonuclease
MPATERDIFQWPEILDHDRIASYFTVPGEPVSKARARTTIKDGKAVTYTPAATVAAEEVIRGWYLDGDRQFVDADVARIGVRIFFYSKDRRRRDIDNMGKLILDALNKIAWADDSQINELILWRSSDRTNPRTEILIYTLKE